MLDARFTHRSASGFLGGQGSSIRAVQDSGDGDRARDQRQEPAISVQQQRSGAAIRYRDGVATSGSFNRRNSRCGVSVSPAHRAAETAAPQRPEPRRSECRSLAPSLIAAADYRSPTLSADPRRCRSTLSATLSWASVVSDTGSCRSPMAAPVRRGCHFVPPTEGVARRLPPRSVRRWCRSGRLASR